ncbi:MAG: ABC-three component system middle component 4 [Pseudomonas oryzihabitans]|uniref:ABC-three component system middle component 4 n=1 Tax=Pseudomonas oryzihabitans TaxID=47885 RepID=UPI00290D2BBB|nr:ABC-three component system middle component 4 [Pseudomonas oryzihabitans]MDU4057709.1 ABC-three component system middle component 4 [Pseudomonas oryzihabitans]
MTNNLPYLLIDDDLSLNFSIVVIILSKLSFSARGNAMLDFEKLQIFFYLVKNPSKINPMLALAGKKLSLIKPQYTFTVESLSSNVDVLYDRSKLKLLLKNMAARGMLECDNITDPKSLKYYLSPAGISFAENLIHSNSNSSIAVNERSNEDQYHKSYFKTTLDIAEALAPLQSLPTTKLNFYLSSIFKRT